MHRVIRILSKPFNRGSNGFKVVLSSVLLFIYNIIVIPSIAIIVSWSRDDRINWRFSGRVNYCAGRTNPVYVHKCGCAIESRSINYLDLTFCYEFCNETRIRQR